MILIGLFGALEIGCVAQQADVARIQKDLEQQIGQLKSEKAALGQQVEEARSAITESRNLIAAQKAYMSKMRSDLAPLNQQIKLLREQDLTSLYGNFEQAEKKISDLKNDFEAHKETFSTTTGTLQSDIQSIQTTVQSHAEQLQTGQTQTTTLAQQIDENNQALTEKMTEFQTAFGQFKETLGSLGNDISQAQTSIGSLQTDITTQDQALSTMKNQTDNLGQSMTQVKQTLEKSGTALGTQIEQQADQGTRLQQQVNSLQDKLTTDTQALRTFLEQDVKTSMDQFVTDMDTKQRPVLERIDALQSDMEALGIHVQADATQVQGLSQSVVKLREAQDVMGSLLGKRGDEIIQQAGRLSERMNAVETHQSTLAEQLQSNTIKTSKHLTEVNASLTSISQSLDQTTQSLSERLTQQEKTVATLNQAIQEFQQLKSETQGQIQQMRAASQVSDQLRQNVEQMTKRMQNLEIHQSELVGKLDSDAQTTTTHLQEVNNGIKSVAQALENVSVKLNTRIASQEQHLNRAITKFQSVQNTAEVSQRNVQHLNDITGTMDQLQQVITTIGTKLGERVDEHEDRLSQLAQRVNQFQGTKTKK
jgi:chromosome segregation ATPase